MRRGRQHRGSRRLCRARAEERFVEVTGSYAVQKLCLGVPLLDRAVQSNKEVVRDRNPSLEPRRLRLVVAHAERVDDGGAWIREHREMNIAARCEGLQYLGRVVGDGRDVDALGLKILTSGFEGDEVVIAERGPIGGPVEEDQQPVWTGERL